MRFAWIALTASFCLFADVRVKSTLSAGASTTESTVYTKGARQRLEYGTDATLIQQCDRKRLLQLDPVTSTYQTIDTTAPAIPETPQAGGEITVNTTLVDTGETKMMFGFKARHIKSVILRTPSAQACEKTASMVETDGWYIDLPAATLGCVLEPAATGAASCQDKVATVLNGKAKLGYPVAYTIKTKNGEAAPETITMQVQELEVKDLPDTLFDVPAGWTDAKAKKAGVLRVAVAPVNDRTGAGGPSYTQKIFKDLGAAKVETVQLNAGTEVDQLAKAKAVEADYLLTATVTEMKAPPAPAKPAGGLKRFGTMVSKTAGLVNEKQAWEARVEYRLLSPNDGTTLLTSAATGRTGGNTFNVIGAVNLAASVGTMMMMGPMGPNMMRGNLGGMLSGMGGPGGMFNMGMMGQGPTGGAGGMNPMGMGAPRMGADPTLMGLQMLSFTKQSNAVPTVAANPTGESAQSKAVEAAISEMLKAVVARPRQ